MPAFNVRDIPTARSYWEALYLYQRLSSNKKVANNTWMHLEPNGLLKVVFHTTPIITYHKDGTIVLNSGGWSTYTTKQRMNAFLGRSTVWSFENVWYVELADGFVVPFQDGVVWRRRDKECREAQGGIDALKTNSR